MKDHKRSDAIIVAVKINSLLKFGEKEQFAHVGITGSTLIEGVSYKDFDIIIYPRSNEAPSNANEFKQACLDKILKDKDFSLRYSNINKRETSSKGDKSYLSVLDYKKEYRVDLIFLSKL